MLTCRLANLEDNTIEMRSQIAYAASCYCASSKDKGASVDGLLEVFQGFTARNVATPHFWLVLKDGIELIGFMVTDVVEYNGRLGIQITQGYLDTQHGAPHISHACMNVVEQLAKANDYKFVSCVTRLDPKIYQRWIKPAGYQREYTAFFKEV